MNFYISPLKPSYVVYKYPTFIRTKRDKMEAKRGAAFHYIKINSLYKHLKLFPPPPPSPLPSFIN